MTQLSPDQLASLALWSGYEAMQRQIAIGAMQQQIDHQRTLLAEATETIERLRQFEPRDSEAPAVRPAPAPASEQEQEPEPPRVILLQRGVPIDDMPQLAADLGSVEGFRSNPSFGQGEKP